MKTPVHNVKLTTGYLALQDRQMVNIASLNILQVLVEMLLSLPALILLQEWLTIIYRLNATIVMELIPTRLLKDNLNALPFHTLQLILAKRFQLATT